PDGAMPWAGLVASGNRLYGTTREGGAGDRGTVFAINMDGSGFTNLHHFNGRPDGSHPYSELVLLGNTLYGTTDGGGASGKGSVFAVNTDGTGFTILHSFTNDDGASPEA